jgi:hypothetical protein
MDRDRPLCAASPWYIGQSGGAPAVPLADVVEVCEDGVAVTGAAAEVADVDGAELADPEQPATARASSTTSTLARKLPATPRS